MEEIILFWADLDPFVLIGIMALVINAGLILLFIFRKVIFDFLNFLLNAAVKISITSAILMATVILMFTFVSFSNNRVAFTDVSNNVYTEIKRITDMIAVGDTSSDVSAENALISNDIQYMERLSAIQKQGSTNDLFAFIYVFLSSILIGIGAFLLSRGESRLKKLDETNSELTKRQTLLEDKYSILSRKFAKLRKDSEDFSIEQNKFSESQTELEETYSKLSDLYNKLDSHSKNLSRDYANLNKLAEQNEQRIAANENYILLTPILQKLSEANDLISFYNQYSKNEYLSRFTARIRQAALRCDKDDVDFSRVIKSFIDLIRQQFEEVIALYEGAADRDEKDGIPGGINEAHKNIVFKCFKMIENKLNAADRRD
jgi:uncharacterized membrane protein/predicted nuclease with TOPRIM domain